MNIPPPHEHRAIARWLLLCCALVAAMVVVGGATRLTGSGLSIVVWEPIMGAIPPLNDQEWREAFDLYQRFPQYQLHNTGMSLDGFKTIFWWEYGHRLLGRLIGLVFFAGFAYFLITRRLRKELILRLSGLFLLGGLQGVLGWYMVASGLVDVPQVSQYRLTAHLALALLIYALMFRLALDLLPRPASGTAGTAGLRRASLGILILIGLTIVSGGFVAGTRAGLYFGTFPLMGDRWVPLGLFQLDPAILNFFENQITIQFTHRVLAMLVAASVVALWIVAWNRPLTAHARLATHLLLAATVMQAALGISTLVLQVPVVLAVAHQGGAVALLTASLHMNRRISG